jgi:hypothetical protein
MYFLSSTKKVLASAALIASTAAFATQQPQETTILVAPVMDFTQSSEVIVKESFKSETFTEGKISAQASTEADSTSDSIDISQAISSSSQNIVMVSSSPQTVTRVSSSPQVFTSSTGIQTQDCPTAFYQVKLPIDGKLCQVFAADLPASMIFFVAKAPSEIINFYQRDSATYTITKQVKHRYMMQSSDKNTTLIISKDGSGTQVDVLVKRENT